MSHLRSVEPKLAPDSQLTTKADFLCGPCSAYHLIAKKWIF